MTQQHPTSPGKRDRGLVRLRRLTVGASVGSVAAIAGFGVLAAATFAGTTKSVTPATTTSGSSASKSQTTPSSTPTPTGTVQPTATPPASGGIGGRTPVATGGS